MERKRSLGRSLLYGCVLSVFCICLLMGTAGFATYNGGMLTRYKVYMENLLHLASALFMVIAKTLIKNRALMGGGPAEILTDVINQLCEGSAAELFVTVWLAILEISTGKGLAANAGHEHPVLRRKDGHFELAFYRHSPAVAVMEGIPFREHSFEMHPGDSFLSTQMVCRRRRIWQISFMAQTAW